MSWFRYEDGWKYTAVIVVGLAAVVVVLRCFGTLRNDYTAACVVKTTHKRVEDTQCRDRHAGYQWFYIRAGEVYPPIGGNATDGAFNPPRTSTFGAGGLPPGGGVVSRTPYSGEDEETYGSNGTIEEDHGGYYQPPADSDDGDEGEDDGE